MSELERHFNVPDRLAGERLPDRYRQPHFLTEAGQLDRKREAGHVAHVRALHREAIEHAAAEAKHEFELNAWLDSRGRAASEAKFRLFRNAKESQSLAQDDPVLGAEFSIIDDEFFRDVRRRFDGWR
jgi:hypothetical protein